MSSSKKQIIIDPGTLSGGQAKEHNTTMKRQRKIKPQVALLRPSTVKKNLLEKIKDYQRRNEETPAEQQSHTSQSQRSDKDLANQFKVSANYLEQLINKKKEARKHKPLIKPKPHPTQTQPQPQSYPQPVMMQQQIQQPMQTLPTVSLELPPELQINPVISLQPTTYSVDDEHIYAAAPMHAPMPAHIPAPMPSPMPAPMPPFVSAPSINQATTEPMYVPSNPIVLKDVPYGCLRNGSKPTYRTYHRELHQPKTEPHNTTVKRAFTNTNPISIPNMNMNMDENADAIIQERQRKLRELQARAVANANANANATISATANANSESHEVSQVNDNDTNSEPIPPISQKLKKKIKQTITKKYKLGRTPGSNVVSVLIKNSDTRRRVQEEHGMLRRESIIEIRKYLHDHGLLKVGSDAPPDVLRNMYETAKLAGEVNNINKHVMLHNFIATADTSDNH